MSEPKDTTETTQPQVEPLYPNGYHHDHENEIVPFGSVNFRNSNRRFGIRTDDRRRHMYVLGKTGMGKTTLLENLVIADIHAGHGVGIVDPHGDSAEKILDFVPADRINDVIYFNPSDMGHPVGFNVLESVDEEHKHLVASGLMGVFKKLWPDVWSPRMEYILNNCILALLDYPGSTMLGINRLMIDKQFRSRVIAKIKDPVVRTFWVDEYAAWESRFRNEAIAPIQNKVGQFLSAALIRNIVAQVKSTFNVREMMDNRKIFIANLSKGRIGEDNARLLGGMLITRIQLAAMERVDVLESDRQDFYLYVDEFQNFATPSFANILSEARKYRLNLIMAHQYIEQLDEDYVRPAVFGNVGTIMLFRVGAKDAEFLENEFTPRFTIEDLCNLTKYEIYLKLMINGVASEPFSARTLPPIAQRTGSTDKVIRVSRERYSVSRADIEGKILRWSGGLEEEPEEGGEVPARGPAPASYAAPAERSWGEGGSEKRKKKKKPKYEYTCTRCKKNIMLAVKLDPSRPIYCDECMEIVRAERNKEGGAPPSKGGSRPPPREEQKSREVSLDALREPKAESRAQGVKKPAEKNVEKPKPKTGPAPSGGGSGLFPWET